MNCYNILTVLVLSIGWTSSFSQDISKRQPYSQFNRDSISLSENIPIYNISAMVEIKEREDIADGAKQIAEPISVNLDIKKIGLCDTLSDDIFLYRLMILSKDAKALSLSIDNLNFYGEEHLFVYTPDYSTVFGPIGKESNDRLYHLTTRTLVGNQIVIEYYSLNHLNSIPFKITRINHVFENVLNYESDVFGSSDSCQVDINCIEGDDWEKEKSSVCRLFVDGLFYCSGAVINNTLEDGKPYVLTANHCYDNHIVVNIPAAAANTEYLFNYESPFCKGPNGSFSDVITGSTVRARHQFTDMLLMELDHPIPTSYYVYYSGFDKTDIQPPNGVGIHHPAGDVKKIATHNITPFSSTCIPISALWEIHWSQTLNGFSVTEGGSSGSPLYNNNHRIIGQLWGGCPGHDENCTNPSNDYGIYGKVFSSWTGDNTPSTRLSNWLDPVGGVGGEYFGLRFIRHYTVNHDAWYTGDVVKFLNVEILPGNDVIVTELQDRFEAIGTLDIYAGATFEVY